MAEGWAGAPETELRRFTEELVVRAIRLGRKKRRTVLLARTSRGRGLPVDRLDPRTAAGRAALDRLFLRSPRHFTVSGLGEAAEPNAINWRRLAGSFPRRSWHTLAVAVSLFLKNGPAKIRFLRWIGFNLGRNVEVMQLVWLDHFRPELIFIGDDSLLGAFTRITVHTYEGRGRFRYGLVEIGRRCTLGAGTGLGVCRMEDEVRTLPGTIVSPYYPRVPAGATLGYSPPPLARREQRLPAAPAEEEEGAAGQAAAGAADGALGAKTREGAWFRGSTL
jgi:hypothetical protein